MDNFHRLGISHRCSCIVVYFHVPSSLQDEYLEHVCSALFGFTVIMMSGFLNASCRPCTLLTIRLKKSAFHLAFSFVLFVFMLRTLECIFFHA